MTRPNVIEPLASDLRLPSPFSRPRPDAFSFAGSKPAGEAPRIRPRTAASVIDVSPTIVRPTVATVPPAFGRGDIRGSHTWGPPV